MLILHRCTTCNHPDYWQDQQGSKSIAGSKVNGKAAPVGDRRTCCRPSGRWGPPESAPRWDAAGKPVATVLAPGEMQGGNSRTCNCDDCWALYRELTGTKSKARR